MYRIKYSDDEINKLWNEYADKRNIGLKKVANKIAPDDLKTVKLLLIYYLDKLWFGSHHMLDCILIKRNDVEIIKDKIEKLFCRYSCSGIIR